MAINIIYVKIKNTALESIWYTTTFELNVVGVFIKLNLILRSGSNIAFVRGNEHLAHGKCSVFSNWFLNLWGGEDAQWVFEGRPLQSPADILLWVQEVNGKSAVLHCNVESICASIVGTGGKWKSKEQGMFYLPLSWCVCKMCFSKVTRSIRNIENK